MEKVYVVMDQDSELIAAATDLASIKKSIANEFLEDDALDMRVEKTYTGYEIIVKSEGIRFRYNAYFMPIIEK